VVSRSPREMKLPNGMIVFFYIEGANGANVELVQRTADMPWLHGLKKGSAGTAKMPSTPVSKQLFVYTVLATALACRPHSFP
jgi:hypothetical protein